AVEIFALAGLCRLSVIGDAGIARSDDQFVGCGIADSAAYWDSILDHGDGDAKLRNALHKFTRAIERIDDPDALLIEAGEVVDGLFREPAFVGAQESFAENGVDCAIGLSHGVVSNFVFGFNGAGREAVEDLAGGFEGGVNAFEGFSGIGRRHESSDVSRTAPKGAFYPGEILASLKRCSDAKQKRRFHANPRGALMRRSRPQHSC